MRSARPCGLLKNLSRYLLSALLMSVSAAHAVEFSVDTEQDAIDTNPGDGVCNTSESTCSLRAAIMEANALAGADTVTVAAGSYTLTLAGGNDASAASGDLNITDDLTIQRKDLNTPTVVASNDYRAFSINISAAGYSPRVNFTGIAITEGPASTQGAHIYNEATLNLSDVQLTMGAAGSSLIYVPDVDTSATMIQDSTLSGGDQALVIDSGSLQVKNSTVSGFSQTALTFAGQDGELHISSSQFTDNKCVSSCNGGAIKIATASSSLIETSTFDLNSAEGDGGAIFAADGLTLHLQSLQFTNNTATGNGGAVYTAATSSISLSVFKTNSATNGGALFIEEASKALFYRFTSQVIASAMLENSASERGGGIYVEANSLIANLTVASNSAGNGGGGVYVAKALSLQPYVVHNTLVHNQAAAGQAANLALASGGNLFLARNLFAQPSAGSYNCDVPLGSVVSGLYTVDNLSDVADCDASADVTVVGPTAQLNLGDLTTDQPVPYYPLFSGSAAINFASDSATPCINNLAQTGSSTDPDYFAIDTDVRLYSRGSTCDVGAVEFGTGAANAGTLEISILDTPNPEESIGDWRFEVVRVDGSEGSISAAIMSALPGEARFQTDYTLPENSFVRFADGDVTPKTFTLHIVDDDIYEDVESFTFELLAATGGAQLYDKSRKLISIQDDDKPDYLQFASINAYSSETAASVQLSVNRIGNGEGSLTADYRISTAGIANPAAPGIDYVSADATGTVEFASGELGEKFITIHLIDNDQLDGDKIFDVELLGDSVTEAQSSRARVTIKDDEKQISGGVFNFAVESRNVTVNEYTPSINLTIVREESTSDKTVYVSIKPNDITAHLGTDYHASSATLKFTAGVTERTYSIQIPDNSIYTGNREFEVQLSENSPSDITVLGQYTIATVTITDDEPNPDDADGIVINPPSGINITAKSEHVNRDDSSGSFGYPVTLVLLFFSILRRYRLKL